jgi:hypothetical protein
LFLQNEQTLSCVDVHGMPSNDPAPTQSEHVLHVDTDVARCVLDQVEAGQETWLLDPSGQNAPAGHATPVLSVVVGQYMPAGQRVLEFDNAGQMLPTPHGVPATEAAGQNMPGGQGSGVDTVLLGQ